ncbi:hypothetical protein [Mycobacterium sp. SMC-4]|uniref:hypothetical protein n=1 Tax=Mycobacterium sp. SMC-4 TaxID=2857059 RepID=UPI003CFF1839
MMPIMRWALCWHLAQAGAGRVRRTRAFRVLRWALLLALVGLAASRYLHVGSAELADWFAAAGTIFAAWAALHIATADRQHREQVAEEEAIAQARLIDISWEHSGASDEHFYQMRIRITNLSREPVLQAVLVDAVVDSFGAGEFTLADPIPNRVLRIVPRFDQPGGQLCEFVVGLKNVHGVVWRHGRADHYPMRVEITIECVDASARHWKLSSEDDPQLHRSRIDPWYRGLVGHYSSREFWRRVLWGVR